MKFTASALILATMALASSTVHGQIYYSAVDGTLTSQSAYYTAPTYLNSSVYTAPIYVPSSVFNSGMVTSSAVPLYVNSTIHPSAMATAYAIIQACEAQGINPESLLESSSSRVSPAQASNAAAWQFLIPLIPDLVDLLLGDGGKSGGGGGGVGSNARLDRIEAKLDLLLKKEGVDTGNGGGTGGRSDLADLLAKLIPILLDRVGDRNNGGGNNGGGNNGGGGAGDGRTEDVIPDSFDSLSSSSASSAAGSGMQSFARQTGTSVGDVQRAASALHRLRSHLSVQQPAEPEDALNEAVSSYEDAMKVVEKAAVNVKRQKVLATTELQVQKLRAEADKKIAEIEGKKPEQSVEARLKALDKRLKALLAD